MIHNVVLVLGALQNGSVIRICVSNCFFQILFPFNFLRLEWVKVAQSCLTLCDPTNCIAHGILQTKILQWVAFSFSRGSSQPRDRTGVSWIAGGFFSNRVTSMKAWKYIQNVAASWIRWLIVPEIVSQVGSSPCRLSGPQVLQDSGGPLPKSWEVEFCHLHATSWREGLLNIREAGQVWKVLGGSKADLQEGRGGFLHSPASAGETLAGALQPWPQHRVTAPGTYVAAFWFTKDASGPGPQWPSSAGGSRAAPDPRNPSRRGRRQRGGDHAEYVAGKGFMGDFSFFLENVHYWSIIHISGNICI